MNRTRLSFIFLPFLIFQTIYSQEGNLTGLKVSKAIFLEMTSRKVQDFIAFDTTIYIENGNILMISDAKAFKVTDSYKPYENLTTLWINDQIIQYYKSTFQGPIWLPEGSHRITLRSEEKYEQNYFYCAFITGIEYSIVK